MTGLNSTPLIPGSSWWAALTPAQATVISGSLTFLAAILGVLLGWWLFSGKVRDLKGAVAESDKLLRLHNETVGNLIQEMREKVIGLDDQFTSMLESLAVC